MSEERLTWKRSSFHGERKRTAKAFFLKVVVLVDGKPVTHVIGPSTTNPKRTARDIYQQALQEWGGIGGGRGVRRGHGVRPDPGGFRYQEHLRDHLSRSWGSLPAALSSGLFKGISFQGEVIIGFSIGLMLTRKRPKTVLPLASIRCRKTRRYQWPGRNIILTGPLE